MSANYQQNVQTRLIEPSSHTNSLTEFILPAEVLFSNWRIYNVGAGVNKAECLYHLVSGVGALVKNIYIYNDHQLISQIQNFGQYATAKILRNTNRRNASINSFKLNSSGGYKYVPNLYKGNAAGSPISGIVFDGLNTLTVPNGQPNALNDGILQLSEFFEMLAKNPVIDARNMKIRIVIEWNSSLADTPHVVYYGNGNAPDAAMTVDRPVMVIDYSTAPLPMQKQTLNFYEVKNDALNLGATTAPGEIATTDARLNAFNGLMLRDLLWVNQPTAIYRRELGYFCSIGNVDESAQFTVNGQQIIPFNALNTQCRKAGLLTDCVGEFNVPFGCNTSGMVANNAGVIFSALSANDIPINTVGELINYQSYGGILINRVIDNLQVALAKTDSGANNAQREAQNIIFFGRVFRTVEISEKGQVNVF